MLVRVIIPPIVPVSVTVKATPLLGCPATVATTGPVAAPLGTEVRIAAALQLLGLLEFH